MKQITKENFRALDHVTDEELQNDIEDIQRENKNYSDEKDILMRNPSQNKLRIYMLEGRILANDEQLQHLLNLKNFRNNL
jgi:hypothetical protein